jgi:hypothetical protein
MQYPCKICGAKINKGSLCVFCADRLNKVIESLKQSIWQDREIREKIEAAGLRPDLKEEDWEKVACLFSDSIFVKRRDRNVSGRASIPSISLILK